MLKDCRMNLVDVSGFGTKTGKEGKVPAALWCLLHALAFSGHVAKTAETEEATSACSRCLHLVILGLGGWVCASGIERLTKY